MREYIEYAEKLFAMAFGDYSGLCRSLRERPEDWKVSQCTAINVSLGVTLWLVNTRASIDFYEDARTLPMAWRGRVWRAFQAGQATSLGTLCATRSVDQDFTVESFWDAAR